MHDILQHVEHVDEIGGLAAVWGRRHRANEIERDAAAEAARAALGAIEIPAGAQRFRELPVVVVSSSW